VESRKLEFYQITPNQLVEEIAHKIDSAIAAHLDKAGTSPEQKEELLTVEETIQFLKCSKQALWNWRKSGILPSYRLGNRVYYKKSDIFKKLIKQE
jgi:predicted DNA-binding transcriptional regulator AlpA